MKILSVILAVSLVVRVAVAETPRASGNTAIVPVGKLEQDFYDWQKRHEAVMEVKARINPDLVFIGDSITHFFAGEPNEPSRNRGAEAMKTLSDKPVLNLGFSGNGKMDAAVGEFLGRLDAAALVIDCLPNMDAKLVTERCIPLVTQLRAARPQTPIVLVEDRRNTNSWIHPDRDAHHTANHAALKEAFGKLQEQGVTKLFYVPGDALLGDDGEGATDGSHPNDLGFVRQADVLEPVIRAALKA